MAFTNTSAEGFSFIQYATETPQKKAKINILVEQIRMNSKRCAQASVTRHSGLYGTAPNNLPSSGR